MAIALVIALAGTPNSGAAADRGQPREPTAAPRAAPEHCPGVRKALRYYTKRWQHWTSLRTGASGITPAKGEGVPSSSSRPCPRYLLKIRKAKAIAAHKAWNRYFDYHYAWSHWLPQKWYRIGVCETGLNWRHSNSSYEGAFGFALQSWDSFVPRADPKAGPYPANAYLATPRQQYEVALAIYRAYGFSGWGCRGA